MSYKQVTGSIKWATFLIGVVAILFVSIVARQLRPEREISDFQDCRDAGGAILETYPEQCRINNNTYNNEAQSTLPTPDQGVDYIGMKEIDAMTTAEKDGAKVRVVERDGEGLPVTMDFIVGRYNLYVRDDVVYKVEVEAEPTNI